ncbi:MAG TPA: MFS transporter [Symbiobacteriaceae bacterium]|nr:MFS transporter [Symbiobacteriaceae bacterium]
MRRPSGRRSGPTWRGSLHWQPASPACCWRSASGWPSKTKERKSHMQRRILGILFAVLFIVMLGFSILFPVEPYYAKTFGATAGTMGWLMASYSLAQFIFSPVWGRLSDRVGRKPVMLIGLAGYTISMTLMGLATSLTGLFVARTLAGILSSATLPTAMAVIADSTTESERAKGMGILGAAFGLGVIFGPFIGGVLGAMQITLPFFVSAGLAAITFLFILGVLPESLRTRVVASPERASRWSAFNRETVGLYLMAFVVTFSLAGLETSFPFLANDRLGLNERSVGYVYAVMGFVAAIVQGGLVGRLKKVMGEERMIPAGLLVSALGMAGIALATTPVMATVAISLFGAGHGLIRPANASLISQRAKVGHGLAIGLLDSMDSLGRILGPVAGGALYAFRDSLPFVSGATLNLLALGSFLLLIPTVLRSTRRGTAPGVAD